jgi:hypothetical protein
MAWSRFLSVTGGTVVGGDDAQVVLDLRTAGLHHLDASWRWP